ncbi:AMP-binding protein, partial [uncultured Methanobrevibacter sp.]|uniref:AMP-binding protein n=1 Tax=uncultured Methanobrevibacter sp. TaxID=253161 RepID=UPI0025FF777A
SDDLVLLDELNETEDDLLYDDVLDAFNDNLVKYSDNILVSYEDRSYTYGESAFIANRIALSLKELNIEKQDRVAFLVERSELYMFCVLGILSVGCVYVPLDDDLPDERIRFILEDTGSHVVIVSDDMNERLSKLEYDGVVLNISDIVNCDNGSLSNLPVIYGNLACILYTSGTTGIPKGIKVTRKAILNISHNYVDKHNFKDGDVYGLYASVGFDAASQAICQTFYAGATLSIIPKDIRLNIEKLNEYMIDHRINHIMMTTSVGKLFMENVDNEVLDVLTAGGEKLGDYVNPNDYELTDGFGPTETFAFITDINNILKIDSSSIGPINKNNKFYILDDNGNRVPLGAVGELYISGYQVADGYLNREKETKNAFIKNPFETDPNYDVMYRTGDMVRVLPDGTLGIVGRRDSQVKIHGNRVELSEIEAVIREIDFVVDVTVQTIKNYSNNEIVAYVVVNEDYDDLKEKICDYVCEREPNYMVPSFVVLLDSIPLNINGKVDKHALPEIELSNLNLEYVAPRSETEKAIVDAFEKVFNIENIGVYDDFVHLGGDSLTAIKLLTYLDGFNISAGDILSLRTPYAIANNVENISFDLNLYSLDEGCPLNEPQLNVYLDIEANSKENSYLIPLFMNISAMYDINDIKSALGVMFDVHPVLGMCVSDNFDVPYLIKGSEPSIIVESDVNNDFITQFLTEPFDLHDSLCRFLIVEEEDGFVIYAVFHHIIFDALSSDVFKRDLHTILVGGDVDLD